MQGIYAAAVGRGAGRRLVELGLMELLSRRVERLGVYRTVTAGEDGEPDHTLDLLKSRYRLSAVGIGVTAREAVRIGTEDLITRLAEECEAVAEECDALLVLGVSAAGMSAGLEPSFDARLAAKIGTPVTVVVGGRRAKGPEEVTEAVRAGHRLFSEAGCTVLAMIVNRVPERLRPGPGLPVPCFLIPEKPELAAPTVGQVATAVHATRLQGDAEGMQRDVLGFIADGATPPVFLDRLRDGTLVITPGDRADVLLGALAAEAAGTVRPAGVVLTLGHKPPVKVREIASRLTPRLPVLLTEADGFTVAAALGGLSGRIAPQEQHKVDAALAHFDRHVHTGVLAGHLGHPPAERITSRMFAHTLVERATTVRRHIVLAEGEDERVLRAADLVRRRGIADLTLLGRADVIRRAAHDLGLDLRDIRILDPLTSPLRDTFARTYALLREHRGMTLRQALDLLGDANHFGTMMVHAGIAHGMVSGAAHATSVTIRPALQVIKAAPGTAAVSAASFVCLADRTVLFADCGLHPCPDADRLADIAVTSARTAERFGIEPRIAMLTYSSGPTGAGGDVERVRAAVAAVRTRAPELVVDGPIRYDTAMGGGADVPGKSPVAGRATVLVFPDLEVADSAYRMMRTRVDATVYGPLLQGLRLPVNAVSRDATVEEIVSMVAVTAVQAQTPAD